MRMADSYFQTSCSRCFIWQQFLVHDKMCSRCVGERCLTLSGKGSKDFPPPSPPHLKRCFPHVDPPSKFSFQLLLIAFLRKGARSWRIQACPQVSVGVTIGYFRVSSTPCSFPCLQCWQLYLNFFYISRSYKDVWTLAQTISKIRQFITKLDWYAGVISNMINTWSPTVKR